MEINGMWCLKRKKKKKKQCLLFPVVIIRGSEHLLMVVRLVLAMTQDVNTNGVLLG